jgi:predicted RNase H-like nuclease (RuvC/YqgF family)
VSTQRSIVNAKFAFRTKLRNTNARLQENLQKSTNELDNLSKKLERNAGEGEINTLQSHCEKLEQENFSLKLKLDSAFEQNKFLREEVKNLLTNYGVNRFFADREQEQDAERKQN